MTDTSKPHDENHGNERTVHSPKAPGQAERVNPTTGESAGTVDSTDTAKN